MSLENANYIVMPNTSAVLILPVYEGETARFVEVETKAARYFSRDNWLFDAASFLEKDSLAQRLSKLAAFKGIATDKFEGVLENVLASVLPGSEVNYMIFIENGHLLVTHTDSVIQNHLI
jgi:hypothetical protein